MKKTSTKLSFAILGTLAVSLFCVSPSSARQISNSLEMGSQMVGNFDDLRSVNDAPQILAQSRNWKSKLASNRDAIIRELEGHLGRTMARGNRGSAKIEALRVEGNNLYVKAQINHKHRPSGIGVPYSLSTSIETRYDPLNPRSALNGTKLCTRGPRVIGSPEMCVTAGQVVKIIAVFL